MTPPRDPSPEAAELRELIRDAHGAIKDLDRLIGQARAITRDAANAARESAHESARAELDRFMIHLQHEANRLAVDLNRAVGTARHEIVRQLTVSDYEELPDGRFKIRFAGGEFDTDPYGDDGEAGGDGT